MLFCVLQIFAPCCGKTLPAQGHVGGPRFGLGGGGGGVEESKKSEKKLQTAQLIDCSGGPVSCLLSPPVLGRGSPTSRTGQRHRRSEEGGGSTGVQRVSHTCAHSRCGSCDRARRGASLLVFASYPGTDTRRYRDTGLRQAGTQARRQAGRPPQRRAICSIAPQLQSAPRSRALHAPWALI